MGFYLIKIWTMLIACIAFSSSCSLEFDKQRCTSKVTCNHYYDLPFALFNPVTECDIKSRVAGIFSDFNHRSYPPVHLSMRAVSAAGRLGLQGSYGSKIITSIDFSKSDIDFNPDVKCVPNLRSLNLSDNKFTSLDLDDLYGNVALVDVDYSHNIIEYLTNSHNQTLSVKRINLSFNNFKEFLNPIKGVGNLEYLDLSNNMIQTLGEMSFREFRNLKYLHLEFNNIENINNSLSVLDYLEELNLENNKIESINYNDLGRLINLQTLLLRNNAIKNIERTVFHAMIFLRTLVISYNNLESFGTLRSQNDLEHLDLSNNKIKSLDIDFNGLNMTYFSVKNNIIEGSLNISTFGIMNTTEMDLSKQKINAIDDCVFSKMPKLKKLLLNKNGIEVVAKNAFKNLKSLAELDLSYNNLDEINFDLEDLGTLVILLLNDNKIISFQENFLGSLPKLEMFDASNNKISDLNLSWHNHLEKPAEYNQWLLIDLNLAYNQIKEIGNSTFINMGKLKNLNMTHNLINKVEYNAFIDTEELNRLDLSFNCIKYFNINSIQLANLTVLMLNNNNIEFISRSTLYGFMELRNLNLSINNIKKVDSVVNLKNIRVLDLSYNPSFELNSSVIIESNSLNSLFLSGTKISVSFEILTNASIIELEMSDCGVRNVSALQLRRMGRLQELTLSHNLVTHLDAGAFTALVDLRTLDLSHNHIAFIQPGVFKDNFKLFKLVLNNNNLVTIHYGVFRGLKQINTIDLSYNNISSLTSDRLYEVDSLKVLNIDHNNVTSINVEEFQHSNLTILSIGSNPLPCDDLLHMKQRMGNRITTLELVEHSAENIDGIACNMAAVPSMPSNTEDLNSKILLEIRDLFKNFTDKKTSCDDNSTVIQPINNYQIESLTSALREILTALKGEIVSPESNTVLASNSTLERVVGSYSNKIHETSESVNQPLIFLAVSMGLLLVVVSVGVVILYKQYKKAYSYTSHNPRLHNEQVSMLNSIL